MGISDCVDESSVITYLVKQNEYIFNAVDEYKLIKLAPLKKKKDDERFFALLEVDIETYKKAVNVGHCLVGLDACSIYCGIDIIRCFKCNGFMAVCMNIRFKHSLAKKFLTLSSS